jgi:1-acyl-sn-glycerol-3-phosphate acyltransferase
VPPYHWWRTVFFLIPAIAIYTFVLGSVSILSSFVDRRGYFAHRCARAWSRLILVTTGVAVDTSGLERLDPGTSYLFASNHQSIYDIPILFWTLPYQLRIMAKASLGRFPFLGWHLARTGHVLVDRQHPGFEIFRRVRALMHERVSLMVFPEGTRSADGRLARFKGGTFMLAIEAGIPIVPVAVDGSRLVMRKGRLMTCPGRVTVKVLDPVPTQGLAREDARPLAERVRRAIAETGLPLGTAGRGTLREPAGEPVEG